MATSIFDNKEIIPMEEDLDDVLNNSLSVWNNLIDYLENEYGELNKEWKFYSKNSGWSFKIANKKKKFVVLIAK
jgi:hypothetical protein